MRNLTAVVFAFAVLSIPFTGCFLPTVNFDPPPYIKAKSNLLPKPVDNGFSGAYPNATVTSVESLHWPPTGEKHFRITFSDASGGLMQTVYRAGGKEIPSTLRHLSTDEKSLGIPVGKVTSESN